MDTRQLDQRYIDESAKHPPGLMVEMTSQYRPSSQNFDLINTSRPKSDFNLTQTIDQGKRYDMTEEISKICTPKATISEEQLQIRVGAVTSTPNPPPLSNKIQLDQQAQFSFPMHQMRQNIPLELAPPSKSTILHFPSDLVAQTIPVQQTSNISGSLNSWNPNSLAAVTNIQQYLKQPTPETRIFHPQLNPCSSTNAQIKCLISYYRIFLKYQQILDTPEQDQFNRRQMAGVQNPNNLVFPCDPTNIQPQQRTSSITNLQKVQEQNILRERHTVPVLPFPQQYQQNMLYVHPGSIVQQKDKPRYQPPLPMNMDNKNIVQQIVRPNSEQNNPTKGSGMNSPQTIPNSTGKPRNTLKSEAELEQAQKLLAICQMQLFGNQNLSSQPNMAQNLSPAPTYLPNQNCLLFTFS
jgi:hypothetical protein